MKLLICGDRNWTDVDFIHEKMELLLLLGNVMIIVGGARGADSLAEEVADHLRMKVKVFKANWKKYGRIAGPKRNRQMLNQKPDMVWAFHDNLDESKGTKDTVTEARRRGIRTRVFKHR